MLGYCAVDRAAAVLPSPQSSVREPSDVGLSRGAGAGLPRLLTLLREQEYLAQRFQLEFPLREVESGSVQGVALALLDRADTAAAIPDVIRNELSELCARHLVLLDDALVGVVTELVTSVATLTSPATSVPGILSPM